MVPILEHLIDTTLMVGTDGRGTLQQQLHQHLRSAILEGRLPAGTRLPATRAFALQQGVSRNTVLAAYDQLIAEGYLETRQGAGTFVTLELPDDFTRTSSPLLGGMQAPSEGRQPYKQITPTGLPATDAFPMDVWARLNSSVWRHADQSLLHYDDPLGYAPLREAITSYLSTSRSVRASADQILIVSGLQQGMKLIVDTLMTERDTIILEDPGYGGLLRTAKACSPKIDYIAIDSSGACVPAEDQKNSLLIITPSHQYPLGMAMPTARRLELIKWARATDSLILEDDHDSEFRYAGRPLSSLQGISNGEHVIYGGSFSKATFPALRLGYLVLPQHLVGPILKRREATDSFPSIMPQLALTKFISEGHFARHLRRLRKIHNARQKHYRVLFAQHLEQYFKLMPSDLGLHIVARASKRLASSTSTNDIKWANLAQRAGLSAYPLSGNYRTENREQGMLLGFANYTEAEVTRGLPKLARYMLEETGF
ncbi:MAG: GntR family transcriptional regulator [Kordiimonadales bacterium]|nr:MAG: GntR family transcriptional regulator [Kordiimonadales bacterium]